MTSSNLRPLLLGLLVPALLPCGCEATGQGQVVQCRVDPECPVGSFCIGGACLPGEYDPLPRTDLGPDEPDGAADLGPADQGPPPPDGGAPDGGAVDGGEPDGGGGGEIRPLLLSWMLPADGSRLEGEAELQLELQTDPRIGTRLLTLFVDDVEVARQARPDPAAPVSLRLDTTLFADGHHQLDAEVQDLTGRTARAGGRTLLFVNQPDRLQVEEGGFLLDGAPVGLVGVEYAPPLDQVTLDADLAAMAAAGINLVAVTAPAVAVEPAENHFTPEGCEPVSMLLQSSLAQGIRVVLRLPSYEAYPYLHPQPGAPAGPAALLWDGKLRAALARRHVNLLERCGWTGQEALAALDLWQRPRAGSDEAHAALLALASWETWSLARHGSAEARLAAWGPAADLSCGLTGEAACPPPLAELCLPGNGGVGGPTALVVDYRLYLDELGARALTDLAAKVGFADPTVLLTASLEAPLAGPALPSREACAVDGGPLDPRQAGEALDFLLLVGDPWDGVPVSPLEAAPLAAEFADHASDFDLFEIS
ncbi:MAG: hypothetical protein RBU45_14405, partial [Myxococcota bacterium]|nr:hypothetical protein [Myxococcota bacterium]